LAETTIEEVKRLKVNSRIKSREKYFVRFSISQRVEHIVLVITFVALAFTGLAEKFYSAGWAEWFITNTGGIATVRLIHRAFGLVFIIGLIYHLGYLTYNIGVRHGRLTMLPSLKDVRDIIDSLRYSFGFRDKHLMFGRYDYRQKFEYWGILFGGTIMIVSGIMLVYPVWFTSFLPGQFIAAARVAHGNEAMLAVLTVAIWHLYDVIFKPGIFPADMSIFTGKISRKRMMEEHGLEYAEVMRKNAGDSKNSREETPEANTSS
jgi:formate dehydrogenase subunit gamma